ncbi:MAG: hypothetical protein AAF519_08010 [Bacteroidota bacterium]
MKWINTACIAMVITVNAMANALPINGMNTGQIAALYPNLFVPAAATFSIWSVIYLGLIGFVLYPFISRKALDSSVSLLFQLTCLLNISWIFAWHYLLIELSVIIMMAFLGVLIAIYKKLNSQNRLSFWLLDVPMNIYFAWICVASIANVTALLVKWGIELPYPELITVFLIGVTQVLVWFINSTKNNIPYSLVIIWALLGIILKRSYSSPFFPEIVVAAAAGILFTTMYTGLSWRNQLMTSKPV